ncbi:MAG: hypothetical protein WC627_10385 [Legionella sp.]
MKKSQKRALEASLALEQPVNIIDNYLYVQRVLDSKRTDLVAHEQTLIQDIASKFPDFRTTYDAYTQSPLLNSDAIKNTTKLLLVAAFAENQALADVTVYVEEAKKLLLLLQTDSNIITYFKNHAQTYPDQPVHNLCKFKLPLNFVDRFDFWLNFVLIYGPNATKELSSWEIIEYYLCKPDCVRKDTVKFSEWPFASGGLYSLVDNRNLFTVLHVLKDLKTFEEMHALLIGKNNYTDAPLDGLINPKDMDYTFRCLDTLQDLPVLITGIMQRYEEHPKELLELFRIKNYGLSALIIASKHSALFKTVLENGKRICGEQFITDLLTPKYNTILNLILATLKDQKIEVIKPFIDALFSICELKHKQQLILKLDYDKVPREVLDYLLESINAKDDTVFLSQLQQLEDQKLLKKLSGSERNFNYYQKLFNYELTYFGLVHSTQDIRGFISRQWNTIISIPQLHGYPFLVHSLFSLIKDNKKQLDDLVDKMISGINERILQLSLSHRLKILDWLKSSDKHTMHDNISAVLWVMLMEMMNYTSDCAAKDRCLDFIDVSLYIIDKMIPALQNNKTRFLSLLTLENPFDQALFSSYLKQPRSEVEWILHVIKFLLIRCSPEEGMKLIKAYQEKIPHFFKGKIIEDLMSYVVSLKRAEVLRSLYSDLKNTWSLERDSKEASELSNQLSLFDKPFSYIENCKKWTLVTEKEINNVWAKVLHYFNSQKQHTVTPNENNPIFDGIAHNYTLLELNLRSLGVKERKQDKIVKSWDKFSKLVNLELNKLRPPELTDFRVLCSKYHKKMHDLEVKEKEDTVKYQNLLSTKGIFSHKEIVQGDEQEIKSTTKKRTASEMNGV